MEHWGNLAQSAAASRIWVAGESLPSIAEHPPWRGRGAAGALLGIAGRGPRRRAGSALQPAVSSARSGPCRAERPRRRRCYRWVRSGPVLVLPDEIAELLDDASPASDAASDATVAAFLTEHVRSDQPNMLQGLQKALRQRIDAGESRHMATVSALAGRSQLLPHPHDCDRTASIPISFGQRYRLVVDLASTSWCRRRSGCRTSPQRLDSRPRPTMWTTYFAYRFRPNEFCRRSCRGLPRRPWSGGDRGDG